MLDVCLYCVPVMPRPLRDAPVPFQELIAPAGLSGKRGFPDGRFRGESGVVGTAEYRYYIASGVDAALFSDVGTVGGRAFSGLRADRLFPPSAWGSASIA
jgi:hemolysin activation/secretion protein